MAALELTVSANSRGISKATYYKAENPIDGFERKHLNIKSFVEKVIKKNPAYGIRRIKAVLTDKVSTKRGSRYLRQTAQTLGVATQQKTQN